MSFDLPRERVVPVEAVAVKLAPGSHPFEAEHAAAIDENWQREVAANPALYNGVMMLLAELGLNGRELVGVCHQVNYATLMYWRRNRGTRSAEHAFAHAALVSRDNALVAIRMGAHTAGAGRVYFAAGSFEPPDFVDGMVDVDANMIREVGEETGLDISGLPRDEGYHLYSREGGTVIFRRYYLDEDADVVAAMIAAFVAAETEPEIEGPVILRSAEDEPDGLAPHMRAIARWHFLGQTS